MIFPCRTAATGTLKNPEALKTMKNKMPYDAIRTGCLLAAIALILVPSNGVAQTQSRVHFADDVPRHAPNIIDGLSKEQALAELSDLLAGDYSPDQIELTQTNLTLQPLQTTTTTSKKNKPPSSVKFDELFRENQVYFSAYVPVKDKPNHYIVAVMTTDSVRNMPIQDKTKTSIFAFLGAPFRVKGIGKENMHSRARRATDILFTASKDLLVTAPPIAPKSANQPVPLDANPAKQAPSEEVLTKRLQTLKTLKEKALLTEEEYQSERRLLLDSLTK